ncbi:MAG: type II toxin-antitoxin system PemK/MazF family toxin [Chloroflexi bacterium]|nr:type II toxin-antitoxin system PemK/MazF family toxin [Chloroflexota bacterium]
MARGDVLFVEFPVPQGNAGHEQINDRPAVVVQADTAENQNLSTLMIVPLTGQLSALQFPHTIRVEPSGTNGLNRPSVLLVFQLRAIDRRRILRTLGQLERDYLDQLDREIHLLLGY